MPRGAIDPLADLHYDRPREFGATREDVRLALERENVESRPVWKPMHLQPVFAGCRSPRRRRGRGSSSSGPVPAQRVEPERGAIWCGSSAPSARPANVGRSPRPLRIGKTRHPARTRFPASGRPRPGGSR